jgi:hypothetical protein
MLFKLHDFFLEIYKIKRNCTSNYAIYMANDTHTHTHTHIYMNHVIITTLISL